MYSLAIEQYGTLRVFADTHPKAQVRRFCRSYRLPFDGRACVQILSHVLQVPDLRWAGQQPPAYSLTVDMAGVDRWVPRADTQSHVHMAAVATGDWRTRFMQK